MALVHRERKGVDQPIGRARLPRWPGGWLDLLEWPDGGDWLKVEEYRDNDTMVIRAELPDVDVDKDVEVTVDEGYVHIRAHREQRTEHKDKESFRSEFRYGEFHRDLPLPKGATRENVEASYGEGILEVRIPCPEEPKEESTKVPVTRT